MDDLREFVRKKIKRGYPSGELREELLEKGHSSEEIERLFAEASGAGSSGSGKELPGWYLISGGLLILGIALTSVEGLWLQPLAWPLIIIGILGILVRFFVIK